MEQRNGKFREMIWIEGKTHRPSLLYYRFLVIMNDVKDLKQWVSPSTGSGTIP
jgi:hypothetical protein